MACHNRRLSIKQANKISFSELSSVELMAETYSKRAVTAQRGVKSDKMDLAIITDRLETLEHEHRLLKQMYAEERLKSKSVRKCGE